MENPGPRKVLSPRIYDVVESYGDYLCAKSKNLWRRFGERYQKAPEAAIAEAMVFRTLQACGVPAEVADTPEAGGPDFLCARNTSGQFKVEATSFTDEKVTKNTSLPNEIPEKPRGQSFALLTSQIEEKATEKAVQFSGIAMPGVLAIASTHFGATLVFNSAAAENALVSQPFWTMEADAMSTDLSLSLFLKLEDDGTIVPKNASISAVLFVAVMANQSHVCGALNPAATHQFNPALLWQIPFIYLKDWPIKNRL